MGRRPSAREIDKRLAEAKIVLREQDLIFAHPSKAVGEINDLGLGDSGELRSLVLELLEEISLVDYTGSRPPLRSDESSIADCELWAFSWTSTSLGKEMYLKFALKNSRFYLVSIHRDRPQKMD